LDNKGDLWKEYRTSRSRETKDQLILEYAPLVKIVAGRMIAQISQHVEYEDLVSYGILGLIDAIDKFDSEKGVKFETFASFRIRGEIIDNIRKLDWVPRTLRQQHKQYEQTVAALEEQLGHEPSQEEIAVKLGVSLEDAGELSRKSTVMTLISLDDYLETNYETANTGLYDSTSEGPEEYVDRMELQQMLADAISKLTEKEQKVVALYYYEDLTLKEISVIMGVTESRVSQIHSRAVEKMKLKLGKFKSLLLG
jgi:RNA polymerase sigma factor for flagellar operon FliA